jgi:hypothetical protein
MTNEPLISKETQAILDRMVKRTDAWVEQQQQRNDQIKIDRKTQETIDSQKRVTEICKKILHSSH